MTAGNNKAWEVYNAALKLDDSERESYLESACAGDEVLLDEVRALLLNHAKSAGDLINLYIEEEELLPGSRINQFEIIEKIGQGGFGYVYLARNTRLHRLVALKFLSSKLASISEYWRRFEQEALTVAKINDPHVVTIHDIHFDEESRRNFIEMEYVEGKDLGKVLSETNITRDKALTIAIQVADGLNAAHKKGIVHRDLKPENIIIRADSDSLFVKVLDFGIAKLLERTASGLEDAKTPVLTRPGALIGTRPYMSPEQLKEDKDIDTRTDIWSLGVVLYEMITGHKPFIRPSTAEVAAAILKDPPTPMSDYKSDIPEELQQIIDKALKKNVSERYQTIIEFKAALEKLLPNRNGFDANARLLPSMVDDVFARQAKLGRPRPLRVNFLGEGASPGNISFDLGAIWGLDRSNFLGIVTSWSDAPIYPALCAIERDLYELGVTSLDLTGLLPRIWLPFDPGLIRDEVRNLRDLEAALTAQSSANLKFIRGGNNSGEIALGFFFEIDLDKDPQDMGDFVKSRCREIFAGNNPEFNNAAIVIHLKSGTRQKSQKLASDILNGITAAVSGFAARAEAVSLITTKSIETRADEESDLSFLKDQNAPPGTHFASWAGAAIYAQPEHFKSGQAGYSGVLEKFMPFVDIIKRDTKMSTAAQVVDELDNWNNWETGLSGTGRTPDEEFLDLINNYLPGHIYELVKTYAGSKRQTARRQSFVFALGEAGLIDAWLEGATGDLMPPPPPSYLFVPVPFGPKGFGINEVVTGLLRKFRKGEQQALIRDFLKSIEQKIRPFYFNSLVDLGLDDTTQKNIFAGLDEEGLAFIIRAEMYSAGIIDEFKGRDIIEAGFWKLLPAISFDKEMIREFSGLTMEKRSILGLCSKDEWRQIELDRFLKDQVLDCRMGRQLCFLSAEKR